MKTTTTLKRANSYWKPLYVNGKELKNIAIYEDGKILCETKRGYFDISILENTISLTVYEVKNANKINLERKDNFVAKYYNDIMREYEYCLYIHASNFKSINIEEVVYMDNNKQTDYIMNLTCEFADGLGYEYRPYDKEELIQSNKLSCHVGYVTRTELKQLGKDIKELEENLKSIFGKDIYVSEEKLKQFNEIYKKL